MQRSMIAFPDRAPFAALCLALAAAFMMSCGAASAQQAVPLSQFRPNTVTISPGGPARLGTQTAAVAIKCTKFGGSFLCECGKTEYTKCVKRYRDASCHWTPKNPTDAICAKDISDD